ncbi:protein-tyrosine phosphatase-like protein [Crucibulum laeve]|uniref:protein-tyrosine-phosphatase n=1 Tax=Crucibulum laeve TaxID=68775 RepID=A0A5C3LVS5_9AGAR|nr:protein-tyrosine phosphatase-like protein [Crucibulum laeve]
MSHQRHSNYRSNGPGHWRTGTSAASSPHPSTPYNSSHHSQPACNVSEIIPRLFISDLSFAENPAMLSAYHITHILSTLSGSVYRPPPAQLPLQPARLHVRVEDSPFAELAAHLPSTTAWLYTALSNPESRVLVHCAEGVSRSVSVVAAFLMWQNGWEPDQAVQYIKSRRVQADPNFGFISQLHEHARTFLRRGHQ